jgi:hypothetical protein
LIYDSTVENYIIIICSCIPVVAGFMKGKFSKLGAILPSLTSRVLRSKPTTLDSNSNPSKFAINSSKFASASLSSQETKEASYHYNEVIAGNGYCELHDALPLAGNKGIRSEVTAGSIDRATSDLESGINRSVRIDQYVSPSAK